MNTNQGGKRSAPSRRVDGLVVASPVSERGAARLAWALTALSAVLLVMAVVLLVLNRGLGFRALSPHLVLVPGFAVVGLVLAVRRPGHAIGWLFVGMGLVAAVSAFAFEYAARGLVTAPGSLPVGSWMAWLAYWTFTLNLPALALLLLLFPDGRVPSPRWRLVPRLLGVAVAGVTVWSMLQPGPIDLSVVTIANPAGVAALGDSPAIDTLGNVPGLLAFLTLFVGSVACALAPFVRRRRAQPIERQQLKWLAFVAGGSGLVGATGFLMVGSDNSTMAIAGGLLLLLALTGIAVGIPVAVGLAILRYRLYEIDRIINRTLVYGLLTAVLGLAYVAGSLVFVLVAGAGTDPPSWLVAAATLAAAAVFRPAGAASSGRLTGASIAASTTRPRPSRRSPPASATRSTSTLSRPSCWQSSTRPWSRPMPRSGFDHPHPAPRAQLAANHGLLPGPTEHHLRPPLPGQSRVKNLSDGPLAFALAPLMPAGCSD